MFKAKISYCSGETCPIKITELRINSFQLKHGQETLNKSLTELLSEKQFILSPEENVENFDSESE